MSPTRPVGATLSGEDITGEVTYLARELKAPLIAASFSALGEQAREQGWSHEEYLAAVLGRQVASRAVNGTRMRISAARFPQIKTFEDFTRTALPTATADLIAHLATITVTARLIVRRVRDQNPKRLIANAQGELFPAWRHHAVFTDSPLVMLQAEADHRRHAIIEQVIADLKKGPLAHLPSGRFNANGAWLVLAAIAFNFTRAAGTLASRFHARATTATIRRQLINIPARVVRSLSHVRLRLPTNWPWADAWLNLHAAATGPPIAVIS